MKQRILFYLRLGKSYIQNTSALASRSVEGMYGCSTGAGICIYSTGVVRIGAYKFKLRAYIPAAMDVLINPLRTNDVISRQKMQCA